MPSLTFTSKRFVITGLLILFSMGLFLLMPANDKVDDIFQGIVMGVAIFLVIPVLYCKIVLKESLKNMGWQKGKMLSGVLASIICISLALGIVFFLSRLTEFPQEYFFPVAVQTNFVWFMLYELFLVSFTALLYELFFRGFIQLLWLKDFGLLSVVLQTVLFAGFIFLSADISWQIFPLLLFSPFAGIIAYVSRSVWYSWIASWAFFFLTDVFILIQK